MTSKEEREPKIISRRDMLRIMGYSAAAATVLTSCRPTTPEPESPNTWVIGLPLESTNWGTACATY